MDTVLAKADPIARIVSFLSDAEGLTALGVGGVGADNEPPYPAIVVSDPPGGSAGRGIHLVSTAVQFEVLGSPDHTIGRQQIKTIAYTVIDVLRTLPEQPYDAQWPVITDLTFSTPGWSPLPTGQPRYLFRATVHSHP